MNQLTKAQHRLETSEEGLLFRVPVAGMYTKAVQIAEQGRIGEAIVEAVRARLEGWGEADNFRVRVVTHSKTISFNGPIADHVSSKSLRGNSQHGMPEHWVIYSEKHGLQITTSETYAYNAQREGAQVKHHPAGEL